MGTGFISTIHSHRPRCSGLRWTRVDSPPARGLQIINRNLVRLLRKNPANIIGEAEWRSLGLACPQIDSTVRSSADDQTYYLPIPEEVRETHFLCTIKSPNQSRLKALVELWDLGRHSTLRDELMQGRDFIVMPPEWWPDICCPRRHGWWVQAVDSAILTRCKRCSGMVQHFWVALGLPRFGGEGRGHWGERAKYSPPLRCALTLPHSCRRDFSR
jgi:hypothetical protein